MAQVDYFLKLDGIKGESTDKAHTGEIDVLSWSWGASNAGTGGSGGGSGAGVVAMQDLHFTMKMNAASPVLMQNCASGKHIASGKLTCRRAGGDQQEYLVITLTDVVVSSYNSGGNSGDVIPTDQVSLNFVSIAFDYKPQDAKGALGSVVHGGWSTATKATV
jgi:type VI secretion system secreted protein Hcp